MMIGTENVYGPLLLVALLFFMLQRLGGRRRLTDIETRLSATLAGSSDAMLWLTADGLIHSCNVNATLVFQRTEQELIGNSMQAFVPEILRDAFIRTLATGRSLAESLARFNRTHTYAIDPEGNTFPVTLSTKRVDGCREVEYLVCVHDESRREHSRNELQRYADQLLLTKSTLERHNRILEESVELRTLELTQSLDSLRQEATHDRLTGLWNRGAIIDILHSEITRTLRHCTPMALVLADLDSFKQVNDTHGHNTGDEVLRKSAEAMQRKIRSYDSVGRFGGEEFLIVLPCCDAREAVEWGERIRLEVSQLVIQGPNGEIRPTLSAGIVIFDGESVPEMSVLIHAADAALYRAKRGGRNRVELGEVELQDGATCRPWEKNADAAQVRTN